MSRTATHAAAALLCFTLTLPAAAAQTPAQRSPAERAMDGARRSLESGAAPAQAEADLALAFTRRARETADSSFYDQADAALTRSLAAAPGNLPARRLQVWVQLGRHEFAAALENARALNREAPDDVLTYGLMADALTELGRYAEAEEAVQWMFDLRPGNLPALGRAAHLREIFGDLDGAAELLAAAYQQVPASESEDRSWFLTHLAHVHLAQGLVTEAEELLVRALDLFPGYHYALAGLAAVRTAQERHAEAAVMLQRRAVSAPHPENFFDAAAALERAGQVEAAASAFVRFAAAALGESAGWDNANRELITYYLEHASRADEALRLSSMEVARRRDIHTLALHARALLSAGRSEEASRIMDEALDSGTQDAGILFHAARIAAARGDAELARRRLLESLAANPRSSVAASAQELLEASDDDPLS